MKEAKRNVLATLTQGAFSCSGCWSSRLLSLAWPVRKTPSARLLKMSGPNGQLPSRAPALDKDGLRAFEGWVWDFAWFSHLIGNKPHV